MNAMRDRCINLMISISINFNLKLSQNLTAYGTERTLFCMPTIQLITTFCSINRFRWKKNNANSKQRQINCVDKRNKVCLKSKMNAK